MHLICGINPVVEALSAGERHFDRLLVVKGLRNRRVSEAMTRAGQLGIPLRFEARETLDRMAGGVPHQGVIAVVSAKPLLSMNALIDQARSPALLVVLDGIEDPRNLGAILRTAEAAGADGVLLPDRRSAGLSETVSRASAGALEHLKVAQIGNVAQALEALKARGIWVVGFDAAGSERWDEVDLKGPVALVLGGEGRGMRRLVRERCDHLVSLPLFGHVGSLNVSVAAGIGLYEVVRQRGAIPSHVRPIPARASSPLRQVVGPAAEDAESDPGQRPRQPADTEPPPAAEEEEAEEPRRFVMLDEDDVWWGSGPPPPVNGESARKSPAEPRKSGRRPERGNAPPRTATPPGAEPPADRGAPRGRRDARPGRRRRRGGGQQRPPAAPGDSPKAASAPPSLPNGAESPHSASPGPESPGPQTATAGPTDPPASTGTPRPPGGFRRRRRRRGR